MKENILHFSLFLNLLLFAIIGIVFTQIYEQKQTDIPEETIIEEDKYQQENYVLIGDSITDWYPVNEMFNKDFPIVENGLAGTKTSDILEKLPDLVYEHNPTKVFLLIGTNDLNVVDEDKDIEKTTNNIIKMVDEINKHRKYAEIYVQSIYPISKEVGNEAGHRTNEEIKTINQSLKEYCETKEKCNYINMYDILIDSNDNLKAEYTKDGLHITKEGYEVITKELERYMQL